MSAQDFLDIFGSDGAVNNEDQVEVSATLNAGTNEVKESCKDSLTLMQQDIPESFLFHLSDEGVDSDSQSTLSGYITKQPTGTDCANTDDLLGIFNNVEPIQAKTNNPSVDLLGGFTQLNTNAGNVEGGTLDRAGLSFTDGGNSGVNAHTLGNTNTPQLNLADILDMDESTSAEMSTAGLLQPTSNNESKWNEISNSGESVLDIAYSEDAMKTEHDDILLLTEAPKNQTSTDVMESIGMCDTENSGLNPVAARNLGTNEEDITDKVESMAPSDATFESKKTHTDVSEHYGGIEGIDEFENISYGVLQSNPPQSESSVGVPIKDQDFVEVENHDTLNLDVQSTMSQGQQPIFTLVQPKKEDLISEDHPAVLENSDSLDTKSRDDVVSNKKVLDSDSPPCPNNILPMKENQQFIMDQSEACAIPSKSSPAGEVKSDSIDETRSHQLDLIPNLSSTPQQSYSHDNPTKIEAWIDEAKQTSLAESNHNMIVSIDTHLETEKMNKTDPSSEDSNVSASHEADNKAISTALFIDQFNDNSVQTIDQENDADNNPHSLDVAAAKMVNNAGSVEPFSDKTFPTVDDQSIATDHLPPAVNIIALDDAARDMKSQTNLLLPELLSLPSDQALLQDGDVSNMQQVHNIMLGDADLKNTVSSRSIAPADLELDDVMNDISNDRQKNDDNHLFQDDTSLNTFKKSDTIIHDTLESTSTVENTAAEFLFQEDVSKHTRCEGENVIILPDTTTENKCSKTMSVIGCDDEVLEVVNELLQKVHEDASVDLSICRNRDVALKDVEFYGTQEHQLSEGMMEQQPVSLATSPQHVAESAEIHSQNTESNLQQTMVGEPNIISSFDELHDMIGDNVSSTFTEKYNSSDTSDSEVDPCDNTNISKPALSPERTGDTHVNVHDTDKYTASVDSNHKDFSESACMPEEEPTESVIENTECSPSADEQGIKASQMPSIMGSIKEISDKDSLEAQTDSKNSHLSISTSQDSEVVVTGHTNQTSEGQIDACVNLTSEEMAQGVHMKLSNTDSDNGLNDGVEQFIDAELAAAQDADEEPYVTNACTPLTVESKNDVGLPELNSPTDSLDLQQADTSNNLTETPHDHASHTTISTCHEGEHTIEELAQCDIDNIINDMPVKANDGGNFEDAVDEIISSATEAVEKYPSLKEDICSSFSVNKKSDAELHCTDGEFNDNEKSIEVSAPISVENNDSHLSTGGIKSEGMESINTAVVSQDNEEPLPIIPTRKSKKKKGLLNGSVGNTTTSSTEAQALDLSRQEKDQIPGVDNAESVANNVLVSSTEMCDLMQGPVAAQLVERLVDDIMYNAIEIVKDEALLETDEVIGSSSSQDESSIDDDFGVGSVQNDGILEVPAILSWTEKISDGTNAITADSENANNTLLDITLAYDKESPPETPVRKKKKQLSFDTASGLETIEARENNNDVHVELSSTNVETPDSLVPEMIIHTNLSDSTIRDYNISGECGENDGVSELMQGPAAAQLVERLVDDTMYNAITIIRDETLSENDEVIGSSSSQDASSIDDDFGGGSVQNDGILEVPTMLPWTQKIGNETKSNAVNAENTSANNTLLDITLDDDKKSPPEAPVRKKKRQVSHDTASGFETIEVGDNNEKAHVELSSTNVETSDSLLPEMIVHTNLSDSTIRDSNISDEGGENAAVSNTDSQCVMNTFPDDSPVDLLTSQVLEEDNSFKTEIHNEVPRDDSLQLSFEISNNLGSTTIGDDKVNLSANDSRWPTSQDGHEAKESCEKMEVLIPHDGVEVEKLDSIRPCDIKEQLNESLNYYLNDSTTPLNDTSPSATDLIAETCVTSIPLLKIDDNPPTTVNDELSTSFINNSDNGCVDAGKMNGDTKYRSEKDEGIVRSDICGISELDSISSNEEKLMSESYDLQEKLDEPNGCTTQNNAISISLHEPNVGDPSNTTVRTYQADETNPCNESEAFENLHDPLPIINNLYGEISSQNAGEVSEGSSKKANNEDDHREITSVPDQQLSPPPLPEADYEDMDFSELPRSKSDITMGGEYFDEGYYTMDTSYKTSTGGSTSSLMKKSVSLPTSYYSNFSAAIPSTVFIDKDLLSDNDDSDAESVKSTTSNDDIGTDSDDVTSSAAISALINQYSSLSTNPTDSSLLGFDPQSSYQAYDNDWEDIVTDPFRRFSGLPVILEESETSEVDESETLDQSDQENDGNVSKDTATLLDEADVEISSDSSGDEAEESNVSKDDFSAQKEDGAESFEATNALLAVDSIKYQIVTSESVDQSSFVEDRKTANDDNIMDHENVANSKSILEQQFIDELNQDSQPLNEQKPHSTGVEKDKPSNWEIVDSGHVETLVLPHEDSHQVPQSQTTLVDTSDSSEIDEEGQRLENADSGCDEAKSHFHATEDIDANEIPLLHDNSSDIPLMQSLPADASTPVAVIEERLEKRAQESSTSAECLPIATKPDVETFMNTHELPSLQVTDTSYESSKVNRHTHSGDAHKDSPETGVATMSSQIPIESNADELSPQQIASADCSTPIAFNNPHLEEATHEIDMSMVEFPQVTTESHIETTSDSFVLHGDTHQLPSPQTPLLDSPELATLNISEESAKAVKENNQEIEASTNNNTDKVLAEPSALDDTFRASTVMEDDHQPQKRIQEECIAIKGPQIPGGHLDSTSTHHYTHEQMLSGDSSMHLTTSQNDKPLRHMSPELGEDIHYDVNSIMEMPSHQLSLIDSSGPAALDEYDVAPPQKSLETDVNTGDPSVSEESHTSDIPSHQTILTESTIFSAAVKKDPPQTEGSFETGLNIDNPQIAEGYQHEKLSPLHDHTHQVSQQRDMSIDYSEPMTIIGNDQKGIEGGSHKTEITREYQQIPNSECTDELVVSQYDNSDEVTPQPIKFLAYTDRAMSNEKDKPEIVVQLTHDTSEPPPPTSIVDESVTSLHEDIPEVPLQVSSTDPSKTLLGDERQPIRIEENSSLPNQAVSGKLSENSNDALTDQLSETVSYHDSSGAGSMKLTHESTAKISSQLNTDDEIHIPSPTSMSETQTEAHLASLKEITNNENRNEAKPLDMLVQDYPLPPGNENAESLSSLPGEITPIVGNAAAADLLVLQNMNDSLVSAQSDHNAVMGELVDEKPPPPPSRKKKKAKHIEATSQDQSEADQEKANMTSNGNQTTAPSGLPVNSDNSIRESESKVGLINNETRHYEQEPHPSSIIDDHARSKQLPEVDNALENCSVAATLIMADEVISSENQRHSISQDSELTEDDIPLAVAAIDPFMSCTDVAGEGVIESESQQNSTDVLLSMECPEEDNTDSLNDGVYLDVSSTFEEEDISVKSISKENAPTNDDQFSEDRSQEIMQEVLMPTDATLHTSVDSSTDSYSSSENEYEISDDNDDIENAAATSQPLQYYHIYADKVVISIMNDLVASVDAAKNNAAVPSGQIENGYRQELFNYVDHAHEVVAENTDQRKNSVSSVTNITASYDETLSGKVDKENKLLESQKVYPTELTDLSEILTEEDELSQPRKDVKRPRFDTTGSIRYLTDSEEEDADEKVGKPNTLISLDDDIFVEDSADSTHSASQDSEENHSVAKRKSLVPPSSLVLSVALDEIDLRDNSDVQETPLSQRLSLSSSLTSSQTSLASSGGEAAGNRRSMLPRLPSLRSKKPSDPVVPEVIKTRYQYVNPEELIPIVPMPDLKRVIKWENVTVRNIEYQIDEAVVQPYKKVISHGGFYDKKSTIIEIFLPYLPAASLQHYDWIMDNLFLYVLATVELLAQGKFSVVIFVGPKSNIPANALLRRWHDNVEYRFKKNVEAFYIVNSTFYFRTMARLFVSRKVNKKMKYVKSLAELATFIPTDFLFVPPEIAK